MGISFEEFIGRLQTVQKNFPDDVETVLNRGANRMIKALKTNSPDSGNDHKGKLNKSWKKKIEGYGKDIHANIYSTAPHFHLVDRGHKIVDKKGHEKGFVQGKHFLQKTIDEQQDDLQEYMWKGVYKRVKDKLDG
nr:MAG: virion morphogenesis family protein [Bacteriophage sp.]